MGGFVWSPVRFFEGRLGRPPQWPLALGVPLICGLLDMTAMLVLGGKAWAAVDTALPHGLPAGMDVGTRLAAVLSVTGFPVYFGLAALMLASADVLFKDSRQQPRLVEFTGLAFSAFLPACLFTLLVALTWTPPAVGGASLDAASVLVDFRDAATADPWLSTAGLLYYVGLAWCSALLGVVLTVVSGFPRTGAAVAAMAIFLSLSSFWS